jgi:hypothetical protein
MSGNQATKQKIPHEVIVRAPGHLPLFYKTQELAEDLGIDRQTIICWAKNGAPHKHDGKGHIWIHGKFFASWVGVPPGPRLLLWMQRDREDG